MVEIIPSILTNSLDEARELISRCEGRVKRIHIDVIDGEFAKNKTLDPSQLEQINTNLSMDFHLMVKEPVNWIEKCVRAGGDRIIGQIEKMRDQLEFVGRVQEVGLKIGLAIDLQTPVSKVDLVVLNDLDVVLVMSVQAGFGGQVFEKKVLDKFRQLDEIRVRDDTLFKLCDDGGITVESIGSVHRELVDQVVVGRSLFVGDLAANIQKLQKAAHKRD